MAASVRCRPLLHKFRIVTLRNVFCRHGSSATGAIFIMVPQIPPDKPDTNPFMQYTSDPKFSMLDNNNVLTGSSKTALNFDVDLRTLIETFEPEINSMTNAEKSEGKDIVKLIDGNKLFDKLEEIVAPIDCVSNLATLLNLADVQQFSPSLQNRDSNPEHSTRTGEWSRPMGVFLSSVLAQCSVFWNAVLECAKEYFRTQYTVPEIQTQISRSFLMRFMAIYSIIEFIDMSNISEDRKRLLRWYMRCMDIEGVTKSTRETQDLAAYRNTLLLKEREFSTKVQLRKMQWQYVLQETERDIVMLLPPSVRKSIAYDKKNYDQGPWRLNMLETVYKSFMEVCPRRDLREMMWTGKHLMNNEEDADMRHMTHEIINTIMDSRDDIALLQGHENYADYRMLDTMAGSVENVFVFLNSCREHFLPMAKKELDDLQNFATSKTMFLDLELWDIAFYRRLHAQDLYRVNKYDKLPYFNIESVFKTMLGVAEQLFRLKFTRLGPEELETIHPDVYVYSCHDAETGKLLGHMHIDPCKRTPLKIVYNGPVVARGCSEKLGITPIVCLMTNFHRGQPDAPCRISYKEVLQLFYQFGNTLQRLMARGDHIEISGWKCMDADMLYMVGFVMEQFAQLPHLLEDMSAHHLTGEKLNNIAIENLIKCQKHMIAYDMCCSLYESAYDIEIHTGNAIQKPFREVFDEMYKLFMPTRMNPEDSRWHSEEMLFGNPNNACSYYSTLWSRMIAANVWEEFELAGFENKEQLAAIGKKFRQTFLERACHDSSVLFREFKGMDPSYECLFKLYPMPAESPMISGGQD